jgi:hypothetical protein
MIENEEEGGGLEFPAPIPELKSLRPARADAEWNALVSGIMQGAAPELARRRAERGFVRAILGWARPVGLAAAAVLVIGAIGIAVTNDAGAAVTASAPSFAEVVDREPASALLATDRPPSASDLERALESDSLQQVHP